MKSIVVYGAGGFGREIACLINSINQVKKQWKLIGFIDDGIPVGHSNRFGKIVGNLDTLNNYPGKIAVAISVAAPEILKKLTTGIINPNVWYPNLIAPDVKFHDYGSFSLGAGNIIFFSCRISCDVKIGNFNIMNSLVSLGHDVTIGDRNVLNPVVRISGDCKVGNDNFFGIQSIILQGLSIGNNTRIGASSVIMRNTKDDSLYFGNPAKKIKS
jgi:sugar O-acyltransferase (sialic acid O-acetyltransferase NeuD family)